MTPLGVAGERASIAVCVCGTLGHGVLIAARAVAARAKRSHACLPNYRSATSRNRRALYSSHQAGNTRNVAQPARRVDAQSYFGRAESKVSTGDNNGGAASSDPVHHRRSMAARRVDGLSLGMICGLRVHYPNLWRGRLPLIDDNAVLCPRPLFLRGRR